MKIFGKSVLSRRNRKCKGPEAGLGMLDIVNSENLGSKKLIIFNILLILFKFIVNSFYFNILFYLNIDSIASFIFTSKLL